MHGIAVIELKGYREWTESLGPRREHIIQQIQAKLHATLWKSFTTVGALPHHFRYDFFIALVNNISSAAVESAVAKIARHSPVPIDFCIGTGDTPYSAYLNCRGREVEATSFSIVAHMDIVNSTKTTKLNGPLDVYSHIVRLIDTLLDVCKEYGCLVFYLGGDNTALFLPTPDVINEIVRNIDTRVRVGVGVAKKPYNAFVKATRGLDYLRSTNREGIKIVK